MLFYIALSIPIRIAMIGQKGMPNIFGGVERHVDDLTRRLVQHGYDVIVYCRPWYSRRAKSSLDGVTLVSLPSIHTKHLDTITHTLFATIHAIRHRADVIHYHGVGPALLAWLPRLISPATRVLVTFHSIDRKHQKWGLLARFCLKLGERCAVYLPHQTIAVSRTIEQYIRDVYDRNAKYIPNGINLPTESDTVSPIRRWRLEPQRYILFVSRLIPHNGALDLIAAWLLLSARQPASVQNKKLVIVGGGHYTSAYVKKLKKLAADDRSIVFTGFQSGRTLQALFAEALFMVHPSQNEGLPINVLEGMGHSLPVLLSDIIEHQDLIRNPEYLFRQGDIESLATRLAQLLNKSPALLQKQGQKNAEMVRREYTWDKIIDSYIELYEQNKRETLAVEPLPAGR
ncbi:MAG: glycosyltransferase family 4 protein [Candidatus Magasanikbacteria bacterium]|nr:glycosyltransferase family 4 protein [Candidatus Magasanikbacteria bacterium]